MSIYDGGRWVSTGDAMAEIIRHYTRLQDGGGPRSLSDGQGPDLMTYGEYKGTLEGLRMAVAILVGIPPEEAAERGDVAEYISRWQASHAAFLGRSTT